MLAGPVIWPGSSFLIQRLAANIGLVSLGALSELCANSIAESWARTFDEPIVLLDGRKLVTLRRHRELHDEANEKDRRGQHVTGEIGDASWKEKTY